MPDPSPRFAACLSEVLQQEGGYSDNPKDPGGATNLGITRKTLAGWRKVTPWWKLAKDEVKNLQRPEAGDIYRALYWDTCGAGEAPAGLDLALFDYAVNSGPATAVKSLQRELRVKADGIFGTLTRSALETRLAEAGIGALIDALCGQRLGFLGRLAGFAVFGRGWTRRVQAIRAAARASAGLSPSSTPLERKKSMNVLTGYKTYIVGAAMLVAAAAQLLGVDLPAFDGHSAGQLAMEAFAILFLRKGLKTEIGNS